MFQIKRHAVILGLLSLIACNKEPIVLESETHLLGGETTIFSSGPDAYTFPLPNMTQEGIDKHFVADQFFAQTYVSAPSPQFGGLGPLYNRNSCESCHLRNGRGLAPAYTGDPNSSLLLRLSIPGSDVNGNIQKVPGFGGQLQDKALFGTTPEGKIEVQIDKMHFEYPDGELVELEKRTYGIRDPYIPLPSDVLISPRNPPAVYGLGLVDAISSADIMELADPEDLDGDGISGKPNMVWDVLRETYVLGKYGWKAEQPTSLQQSADAAHNDMGLTSYFFENESCADQLNCQDGLQNDVDVDEKTIELFAFYFETLGVPAQRRADDAVVLEGQILFDQVQCSKCHIPSFTTSDYHIAALANQTIYPYSDFLLHDMGPGLSDSRPSFQAKGSEWRTPPLWGIGLAQVVNQKARFLHDGRAGTIEEAILWHSGEAKTSLQLFTQLEKKERDALLQFVNSL